VVLHSARPTLILPCVSAVSAVSAVNEASAARDTARFDRIGTQVLVAWDDSREAARAIADALPLLRRAARVQVISWHEADDGGAAAARLDALRRWLMWQGVVAEVQADTTPIDIADTMLSRAADMNADLLVMGAYGHARWAEWALGGATRGMLESMTVPVLMSH
jgi:nucleotide-binding universal stress UspA family protein